ncbi:hypothetical protein V492_06857 [Pseudogymnoascus sp. VKM F-4246]|nr:hypothetical protein V492_06857 [Pseudogymnoascus sp. VKM F-4246]
MRLLNATTYEFREFQHRPTRPKYAILSHRWFPQEITFATIEPVELQDENRITPQLSKIRNTCLRAREDKLEWVWIDSCCINKESSEEVTRSINAMFKWYQEAAVCYTYLSDVTVGKTRVFKRADSEDSEWFERGWTLQELIAPRTMKFFDANWVPIGTRAQLAAEIQHITGIEARFLDGSEQFRSASIATRLSWQSRRKTTEEEDIAYSLVGIMGVSLVPIYGEGRQAFLKLQQELLKTYRDESIFAWTAPPSRLPKHDRQWDQGEWGLLAPWIDCFQDSGDVVVIANRKGFSNRMKDRPAGGIAPIAGGVKFPMPKRELRGESIVVVVLSALTIVGIFVLLAVNSYRHSKRREWSLTLNCWKKDRFGRLRAIQVFLCRDSGGNDELFRRCRCEHLGSTESVPSSITMGGEFTVKEVTIIQPSGVWWPVITEPLRIRSKL